MTNKYDLRWKKGDYHYSENLIPKLKDDAPNVIKLRDDEPSGYYCLDGIFI